ncbi:cytochrome P450 [Polyplosphaeria fusca]|uniref:Cytochrome P450 n=1 Tax=Polyplosphaeria fusca TaxID=682080 RepID=A0A9P4UZH7_9PLEO|nr:cytochrome P450 [Polyplosphaeria fusca]
MLSIFGDLFQYASFAIFILVVCFALRVVYNIFLHPLAVYPGPRLWSCTGHLHHDLHQLHQQYGPVAWSDIYSSPHGKPKLEKNKRWGLGDLYYASIASPIESVHRRNRRALMGAFTERAVQDQTLIAAEYIALMVMKGRDKIAADNGAIVVDLVDWLNFLYFDISGHLSFGESFHSVANEKAPPWVEISCSFGKGSLAIPKHIAEKAEFHKELARVRFQQRLNAMDAGEQYDYLAYLQKYNEEKGVAIPPHELQKNMMMLIFAGPETTGTAFAAIFSQLVRHPSMLTKLQEEVRNTFIEESALNTAAVRKLKYLTAVIQEGLRLAPPTSIGNPRVIPRGGAMLCGRFVPGGTFVSMCHYPTYRSPFNFSRSDDFIPERFLKGVEGDDLSAFEPSSTGRHSCMGKRLAWAEMRLIPARVLFAFDIRPVKGYEYREFGEQKTYMFWDKETLMIEILRRTT